MTTVNDVDFMMPSHFPSDVVSRITSAVCAAYVRSRARRAYRQMLQCDDHLLSDIGLTRDDVRKALHDCERA